LGPGNNFAISKREHASVGKEDGRRDPQFTHRSQAHPAGNRSVTTVAVLHDPKFANGRRDPLEMDGPEAVAIVRNGFAWLRLAHGRIGKSGNGRIGGEAPS